MLLHRYGKRWIYISQNLRDQTRSQQQCRSHGQKYLESLKRLKKITESHLRGGKDLTTDDFLKKKSYEEAQAGILRSMTDGVKLDFIPEYLQEQVLPGKEKHKWELTNML
jgi:hypothetical protein